MGALYLRALGLDQSLGLDLGRRRALGICAFPLWPLGLRRRFLGLGSGALLRPSFLCPRAGCLVWGTALWDRIWIRVWRGYWLGAAVLPLVSRELGILLASEYLQHPHYEHQPV